MLKIINQSDLPEFPVSLTELYKKEYLQYNYITLLEACSKVTIELTPEMVSMKKLHVICTGKK